MTVRRRLRCAATVLGLALIAQTAQAQIGFDEFGTESAYTLGSGYMGFDWSNFSAKGNGCSVLAGTGYCNGVVSPNNTAYNGAGGLATISSGSLFTFGGAWFTGAWNDGLLITITGWNGATQLFSSTFETSFSTPTFFLANWTGIDQLQFTSSGGTPQSTPGGGGGTHFAMDDIYFERVPDGPGSTVPEPATMSLLATGLVGLGASRRRKPQRAA